MFKKAEIYQFNPTVRPWGFFIITPIDFTNFSYLWINVGHPMSNIYPQGRGRVREGKPMVGHYGGIDKYE